MKEHVLQKIQVLRTKASEVKKNEEQKPKNTFTSNSLAENIKSKEQAETFKKLLKAL